MQRGECSLKVAELESKVSILSLIEIEETQKNNELKIAPVYDFDYKNAHDFLNGYLQIEMEPNALNYYIENGKTRNK